MYTDADRSVNVSDTTILAVPLPAETRVELAKLSEHMKRDEGALGEQAISQFVAREFAIIDAIERGRDQVRAGRVTSHDDVMREAREIIRTSRAAR